MLLKIDFDPTEVVERADGRIVLQIDPYKARDFPVNLMTIDGDFSDGRIKSERSVVIGVDRGTISLGKDLRRQMPTRIP